MIIIIGLKITAVCGVIRLFSLNWEIFYHSLIYVLFCGRSSKVVFFCFFPRSFLLLYLLWVLVLSFLLAFAVFLCFSHLQSCSRADTVFVVGTKRDYQCRRRQGRERYGEGYMGRIWRRLNIWGGRRDESMRAGELWVMGAICLKHEIRLLQASVFFYFLLPS